MCYDFEFLCEGASLLPGGPFLILTPSLSSYRRQLWISATPVIHAELGQEAFTKTVAVWLRVEGVIDAGGHKVLVGGQGHNRTRTIQVGFDICYVIYYVYLTKYTIKFDIRISKPNISFLV